MSQSNYRVELVNLNPQPALVVRAEVARAQLGATLASILPRAFQHAMKSNVASTGMPFTRYLSSGEPLSIEAGVPVSSKVDGAADVLSAELPGGKVARTVHQGPYDGLPAAHAALHAWAKERGLQARNGVWEVYVTDPSTEPDVQKWQTHVFLAVS
jgi:effector-binding domain-containing protein